MDWSSLARAPARDNAIRRNIGETKSPESKRTELQTHSGNGRRDPTDTTSRLTVSFLLLLFLHLQLVFLFFSSTSPTHRSPLLHPSSFLFPHIFFATSALPSSPFPLDIIRHELERPMA